MRRKLLLAAALIIPLSGITLATSPSAFAGVKITCLSISGPLSSLTISGCTGGNTGGGANNVNGSVLAVGGTVQWNSGVGHTITFGAPVTTGTSAKKCPGYVKGAVNEPVATKFQLPVTADVGDGIKVPGKAKGAVCISLTGNVTALKKLVTS